MSAGPRPGVPWYVHPAQDPEAWARLGAVFRGADGVADGFVVLNVDSGPGEEADVYYPAAVEVLRAAAPGLTLLGYVDLDYGRRCREDVLSDAGAWQRRYGVHGLMLDRFPSGRPPTSRDDAGAALAVVARLRGEGVRVVAGNPGVVPVPEVADGLDVVCEFEGPGHEYVQRGRSLGGGPGRWHLVHSCGPGELREAARIAEDTGVGHVFCTDGRLPHPWAGLPAGTAR